jgi:hypothetical protein
MKIAVDKSILFGYEAFSEFGNVKVIDGRNLINDEI